MKMILSAALLALVLCLALTSVQIAALPVAAAAGAASLEPASAERGTTFRIAGDMMFPPYEYTTAAGSFVGFNVDLMHAIAIELGINVELIPMSWTEARAALDAGAVDALQGMKYNRERDMSYDFSEPYLTSSLSIFVRPDNYHVSDVQHLQGMRVAVQSGDVGHEIMLRVSNVQITAYDTQRGGLEAVVDGTVDAFVGNRLAGIYTIQRTMMASDVKMVGGEIDPQPYAMAFRQGDADKVELFNVGLARVRGSGLYDKIYAKWFGESIQPASGFMQARLRVLAWVLGGAGVLTAAISVWNELLRREVARRTAHAAQLTQLKDQLLASSFNGVAAVSADMMVIWANPAAAHLLGASLDDVIGRRLDETPLGALVTADAVKAAAGGSQPSREAESILTVGSEERVFSFRIGPVSAPSGGEPAGTALVIFRDVTLAKRADEVEAMQHKMDALARTISGIAHEVRNPLTAISAFVELLPAKYESEGFRDEISVRVPAEIRRVNSIITDLMNFARPRKAMRRAFDLIEAVQSVCALLHYEAEARGVAITTEDTYRTPRMQVFADPDQIKQVIWNILFNAVQASSEGGQVLITARTAASSPRGSGGGLELIVADGGAGIAPGDMQHLFEPFFTSKPGGTGLGLAVSYKLMQENEGDLSISSEVGRGTRVTLHLPAAGIASTS